jgi:hypothetical protein
MAAEILLHDGFVVLYKMIQDVTVFVLCDQDENELIMLSILSTIEDALTMLLKKQMNRITLMENMDLLLLTLDEICDDGLIFETEFPSVAQRVAMKGVEHEVPLAEQTFSQALQSATDQLVQSFR